MNLEFFVKDKRMTRRGSKPVVADTAGHYTFSVDFDREWDGLVKVVVFTNGRETAQVLYTGQDFLPDNVSGRGNLYVSCCGYRNLGDTVAVVRTVRMTRPIHILEPGQKAGGDPAQYTPTVFERIVAAVRETWAAAQEARQAAADLQSRRDQGFFDGAAATVTVEGAEEGESPAVYTLGTARDAQLHFVLPRGRDGGRGPAFAYEDFTAEQLESLRGPAGPRGETGPQGPQGADGPCGETGPQGPAGADGTSFTVLGRYDSLDSLLLAHPAGTAGQAYAVGTAASNTIYVWSEDKNDWDALGPLQGPAGPQGPRGEAGPQGPQGEPGTAFPSEANALAGWDGSGQPTKYSRPLQVPMGGTGRQILTSGSYMVGGGYSVNFKTPAQVLADIGAAPKMIVRQVALPRTGWSNGTQTVAVEGVLADEAAQLIRPVPALDCQAAYMAAGILCTGQGENSLTFTAQETPAASLGVYVVIQEVDA